MTKHLDDIRSAVAGLHVDRSSGQPARHQPITLLWAMGRAATGRARLLPWKDARPDLKRLLKEYGRPGSDPAPQYPFVALQNSGLWQLDGVMGEVPVARGSKLLPWLNSQNPRGGLEGWVYDLLADDPEARRLVTDDLVSRFFEGEAPHGLLRDALLLGPVFDGFGPVPGVKAGTVFANRAALHRAQVHRPLQGGICGTRENGAESIVVSGGYEDDEDLGDTIIYTGQGGRDERTGQQASDQQLTLGNAALVTSRTAGRPVRVVRGASGDPQHSPASGYRYDGLYLVDDYWSERGQSGHLVWRYRLVKLPNEPLLPVPPLAVPTQPAPTLPVPAGQETLTRVEASFMRIVRSSAVANYVKRAHDFSCQVCGIRLGTPTGAYAEAAHIQGLGRPHNGPDIASNVLCLCPNHHKLFDFGMLVIADDLAITDRSTEQVIGRLREIPAHQIERRFLAYHREHHAPA
ncbi:YDG/SRA domain-containing protein [Kitasatospora sp. NPDC004272]